jgi:erythromycin esterase
MAYNVKIYPSSVALAGVIMLLIAILFFQLQASTSTQEGIRKKINATENIYTEMQQLPSASIVDIKAGSDYSFLDQDLAQKSIVLLGEQQHGDGATFTVKSDIIRHLHQKGFNVLFFESSFFETAKLWQNIQAQPNLSTDFSKAIYQFWGRSAETQLLRTYISQQARSTNPLEMAGIDYQMPYAFSQTPVVKELQAYLKNVPGYQSSRYDHFWQSLLNKKGPVMIFNTPGQKVINKDSCMLELNSLHRFVSGVQNKTRTDQIFERYLYNIYHFYFAKITYGQSPRKQGIYRDSIMFENVKWQMDNLYKGKKVVIWTANFHATYTPEQAKPDNLGAFLKQHYQDQVYSILFTSYQGNTMNISTYHTDQINTALPYTFEAILRQKGKQFTYVRFPENGPIRNTEFNMRFLGHNNIKDKGMKMMDSFIFIRDMKPATFITR